MSLNKFWFTLSFMQSKSHEIECFVFSSWYHYCTQLKWLQDHIINRILIIGILFAVIILWCMRPWLNVVIIGIHQNHWSLWHSLPAHLYASLSLDEFKGNLFYSTRLKWHTFIKKYYIAKYRNTYRLLAYVWTSNLSFIWFRQHSIVLYTTRFMRICLNQLTLKLYIWMRERALDY